ncbi:nucleolar protein 16 [Aplysia californica]|uniref:Nucleolar protein 16 n=1 Tax=Aplysia californica TaxID=6500 RepID=A0ABM0JB57_APLCA|nr:nucleolar protein 16 [Aplysia californica]
MGKVKKQKKHLKFDYNRDRKKNWKKAKGTPTIKCDEIKAAWDETKSVKRNMRDMGLSADPNKTLRLPRVKPLKMGTLDVEMEIDLEKTPTKTFVVDDLEVKSKIAGKKKMTMSDEDAGFCVYMMDKYGDNYVAMARDERNYYQDTPKQIQRKINRFKSIPKMYDVYAESKKESDRTSGNRPPLVSLSPHRYMTRWSEACRRNGHFYSPPDSSEVAYAPHATLCRVRRRLQFGRKPPKERDVLPSTDKSSTE